MEKFIPQIEAFLAELPEGAVAQLSYFQPAGTDKHVLALVLSDDALSTQAGINAIDQGLRAQAEDQRQRMLNSLINNASAD